MLKYKAYFLAVLAHFYSNWLSTHMKAAMHEELEFFFAIQ